MQNRDRKTVENRLRLHARARGFVLERNPVRTITAPDHGRYRLTRSGAAPTLGYPFSLDEVETQLATLPAALRGRYKPPIASVVGADVEPPNSPTGPAVVSAIVGTNRQLIAEVSRLWISPTDVVMDVTFGRGAFWKRGGELPHIRHDIALDGVDLRRLPEEDSSVNVVVLDPPYRPSHGGATSPLEEAYGLSHVDSITDVLELYAGGIREAARVLRPGGRVMVKCADLSYSRRLHFMHIDVLRLLAEAGFQLADMFVLVNTSRLPLRGRQLRARRSHSYLIVARR